MAITILLILACPLLLMLAYVLRLQQTSDRRRLQHYVQQIAAERQLDALTRVTLAAMRQAVRDSGRSSR